MDTEPIVDLLDAEWYSLGELCTPFRDEQWATEVSLPGWTVQDCLSHVVGVESSMLGEPVPDVDITHLAHVATPFQQIVEVPVEHRRGWGGERVLAEYFEVIGRRLEQLRGMTTAEFDEVAPNPLGETSYRDFMDIRLFDCWMHEQDIRRAVGEPGNLAGPVVDRVLGRFRAAMGYVIGKKAGAPDGSTVVVRTTGPTEVTLCTAVVDGRARLLDAGAAGAAGDATATLILPFPSFVALCGGRWTAEQARAQDDVRCEGDPELAARVLASLAFTP